MACKGYQHQQLRSHPTIMAELVLPTLLLVLACVCGCSYWRWQPSMYTTNDIKFILAKSIINLNLKKIEKEFTLFGKIPNNRFIQGSLCRGGLVSDRGTTGQ